LTFQHYNELFDADLNMPDETLDDLLIDDEEDAAQRSDRRQSANIEMQNSLSHFGPRQVHYIPFFIINL
jgi:hypothetical protein